MQMIKHCNSCLLCR